ncbi:hypothetical protein CR513_44995, partial [Mucuna pruriens]
MMTNCHHAVLSQGSISSQVFPNTPPHAQHYWAWCMDNNGGWPFNRSRIGFDTILKKIDKHFIKEKLDGGFIVTAHIHTGLQVADVFPKGLPSARFQDLIGKLGMIDIHLPT